MTFADLAANDQIFLDANTLVYHFASHQVFGPAANQLMTRIENQQLEGFTSTHVLSETAHRLMMIEAATLPGWKQTKVKLRLLQQPSALQSLTLSVADQLAFQNQKTIDPGTQSERRGGAGPVKSCLAAKTAPAAVLCRDIDVSRRPRHRGRPRTES